MAIIENLAPQCLECGNCTIDDFIIVVQNLINAALELVGLLAVTFAIVGGVMLLISGGSSEMVKRGRKTLGGAVKGMIIVLLAWMIVNTVITMIVGDQKLFGQDWFVFKGSKAGPECSKLEERDPAATSSTPVVPGNWKWAFGLDAEQVNDASPDLTKLINCLYDKVDGGVTINSISDDGIYAGRCSVSVCNNTRIGSCSNGDQCRNEETCVHRCGSCHYGNATGPDSNGFSNAVDVDETGKQSQIQAALDDCYPGGWIHPEGNHLHIQTSQGVCPNGG